MVPPPLRLLGLDPGLRHTGWGVIDVAGNRLTHVADGTVHSDGGLSLADRLRQLHDGLVLVVERFQPAEAAVEETFVNKNPASTLKLGQARGVALLVPALAGLPVAEYATAVVKKSVVGTGAADKTQVATMIRHLLPGCMPDSPDAADALAVAVCHAHFAQTKRMWVGEGVAPSPVLSPSRRGGGEGALRALAGRKSSGLETTRASDLRHHSLDVESLLWQRLRNRRLGAKFRRQEPILGFTVDFVDHERGLVIELDGGGQHAERAAHDQRRIERLQQAGFRVLRFRGNDVIDDIDGVLETIHHALNAIPARRSPSGVPALAVDDDGGGP